MKKQFYEKRSQPRYKCSFSVKIITDNKEFDGTAVNISLGGIQVVSNQLPSSISNTIRLHFKLPNIEFDTNISGRMRWNVENVFGMQFGDLLPADILALNQFFKNCEKD
ncbi:putative PilZ domain-containing protein [Gammaproteobacteria bacterium]